MDEFNEVFVEETGLCKGVKARINMKSDATPTFRKARPLPYAMKKKVENELDRLQQKGISAVLRLGSSCCSSSEA